MEDKNTTLSNPEKSLFQSGVPRHMVSSVKCQVSRLSSAKTEFVLIARAIVDLRWLPSPSRLETQLLEQELSERHGFRDLLLPKEQLRCPPRHCPLDLRHPYRNRCRQRSVQMRPFLAQARDGRTTQRQFSS